MTDRLKVGVAGGGLIAQVEHIPNLLALKDKFVVVGVSDPSPTVRAALADRFGVATVPTAEDLLALGLDALVIAAPDPWHGALATAALAAGLHVFCEKPLCYGVGEIDDLIAAEARSGTVLQVGYMKRFDPSYEAALERVAGRGDRLRYLSVEVHDPDAAPFVGHHPLVAGRDVPADLVDATGQRRRAQVRAALGFDPSETIFRGFAGAYSSALVHDVNAAHGLLDAMGLVTGGVTGAAIFAGGVGGQGAVALQGGEALWTMTHVEVPGVGDYAERISLYFEDEIVELVFPAPYLNHHPTRLTVKRGAGSRLETTDIRIGYEEAFVRELEAFWHAIVKGGPRRNTAIEARRDQALLVALATVAAGLPSVA
ncbi:Gfo/Idh/MocA family protein [Segnochrobactrum spirostomi]|uniref:Gfo/Idh/MocA family oxidoreductase n=1 Tax=Segnochrobactrum spirostomi TaxID=2608987 RepID=A0A6A7Y917_9HYPH|nr:Gfo/Idh/MocA family oxidoreductase [Segnochrobactrum spirostomi]MQT15225.1 Gfo/Idh/MocA family oxidoreductase [Segnochrobactrum spirostomi]